MSTKSRLRRRLSPLFGSLGESLAGGKAVECYAPYREAPVYDTVQERVLFRGAQIRDELVPAIYGTRKVRRLISPGRVESRVLEAEYQTIREKVLLYPERTVARTIPAVTRPIPPRQGERAGLCLGISNHQRQARAVQGQAQGGLRHGRRDGRRAAGPRRA